MSIIGFRLKEPPHPFSVATGLRVSRKEKVVDENAVKALLLKFNSITDKEHERIKTLEQHFEDDDATTNPEWLAARKLRITGSAMGSVGYCNPYESADDYLLKKTWPELHQMDKKGQENCRWGNLCEPLAEESFAAYMATYVGFEDERGWVLDNYDIQNLGLYVCKAPGHAMLGMSPDGILYTTWTKPSGETVKEVCLIEYKCPVPRYDPDPASREKTQKRLKVVLGKEGDDAPLDGMHTYYYSNGDWYAGWWENGKRHGGGRYTFLDGMNFEGQWDHGRLGIVKNEKKFPDPNLMIRTTSAQLPWWNIPRTTLEYHRKFMLEHKTWQDKCKNDAGLYKECILPKKLPKAIQSSLGEYPSSDWADDRRKLAVPSYYMAQIQYGMTLFGMSDIHMHKCYFVVHCPMRTSVTEVDKDVKYGKWLIERAKEFWTDRFAKNYVLRASGLLLENELV